VTQVSDVAHGPLVYLDTFFDLDLSFPYLSIIKRGEQNMIENHESVPFNHFATVTHMWPAVKIGCS
jgi:hypothetical protein